MNNDKPPNVTQPSFTHLLSPLSPSSDNTRPLLNSLRPSLIPLSPPVPNIRPLVNPLSPPVTNIRPLLNPLSPSINNIRPVLTPLSTPLNNTLPVLTPLSTPLNNTRPVLTSLSTPVNNIRPLLTPLSPVLNPTVNNNNISSLNTSSYNRLPLKSPITYNRSSVNPPLDNNRLSSNSLRSPSLLSPLSPTLNIPKSSYLSNNNNIIPSVSTKDNEALLNRMENNMRLLSIIDTNTVEQLVLGENQMVWAQEAINKLIVNKGYIDTSTMGGGKSYILLFLSLYFDLPLFIIGPLTVVHMWNFLCKKYGVKRITVINYEKLRSQTGYQPKHEYLHRYDLNGHVSFAVTNKFKSIVENGILLVIDEFQNLKNNSSKFKACNALLEEVNRSAGPTRFGLISGTPIDKESQIINLLRLLGFIRSKELYQIGANTPTKGFAELINACYNIDPIVTLETIKGMSFSPTTIVSVCYNLYINVIKPRYSGSMTEAPLPPGVLRHISNGFYNINPANLNKLTQAIAQLESAIVNTPQEAFDLLDEEDIERRNNTNRPSQWELIQNALVKIENAKAYDMARVAKQYLDANPTHKFIIGINFTTSTIPLLLQHLNEYSPLILTGKIKEKHRPGIIDAFSKNINYRLLIMNIKVGGVGISLHDTVGNRETKMILSPNYDFLSLIQAAYRIARMGQKSSSYVSFFYGKGVGQVEKRVLLSLITKSKVLRQMLETATSMNMPLPDSFEDEIEP